MNGAEFHLLINHVPILGTLFGLGLAAWGIARREDAVVRAALGVFVLVAVASFVSVQSGEKAEDIVEQAVPGVEHSVIHDHEEAAERAALGAYALGVLSLLTLGLSWGKALRRPYLLATVAVALVVGGLMVYTGSTGGDILHPDLSGTPAASP